MSKTEYDSKMNAILMDMCTYKRVRKDPTTGLQEKNNKLVTKLFELKLIDEKVKYNLINRTSIPPKIYGLPKIHKEGTPLRPICSFTNSPTYELSRYISKILKVLTVDSKYNIKDAIDFKSRINNQHIEDDEILISFDVISLFPSIPVNLAISAIKDSWSIIKEHTHIPMDLFIDILTTCIKDARYFAYKDKIYEQQKGMPMGSPISPIIADIIMEKLLDETMNKLTIKPRFLTKYVDDIFCIVKKEEVENTLKTLNMYNKQLRFTMESELNNQLPYLDSLVQREGKKLLLDWYQKPTASGRLINYHSKHPRRIKINTATNFIQRVLKISDRKFHAKNKIKIIKILKMNDFPSNIVNELIKRAEGNRAYQNTKLVEKTYKRSTYIPGFSERFSSSNMYNSEKYQLAFRSSNTNNNFFSRTKTKIPHEDKSNVVYKIKCNGDGSNVCQKAYVGTTKSKLKTRISSHKSDQKTITKPIEQKTALAAHCQQEGHTPNFKDVDILAQENNYKRRYMLEMLHIINVPPNKRMNYKTDTEHCAQIYRNVIEKHKKN
ncbi:uncharacterized protein LOC131804504 [Musca domestica]|uniref:Uncharacterized protein LOC131804504 n=1 Tax=Musca domestica TaxID=7370 RepID=A0ABM3VCE9_MUSDO|nr:uncharacterized protein LOC131804504 [Musca domestica]